MRSAIGGTLQAQLVRRRLLVLTILAGRAQHPIVSAVLLWQLPYNALPGRHDHGLPLGNRIGKGLMRIDDPPTPGLKAWIAVIEEQRGEVVMQEDRMRDPATEHLAGELVVKAGAVEQGLSKIASNREAMTPGIDRETFATCGYRQVGLCSLMRH